MKKIVVTFLLLFITVYSYSQTTGFSLLKGKLVWENVYISKEPNVAALIARNSRLKITSVNGSLYKGTGTGLNKVCAGTSKVLSGGYNFNFEIELSQAKYRVTLFFISFNKGKKKLLAENHFLEKGKLKQTKEAKADLKCMEDYFIKIFEQVTVYKNRS